MLHAEDGRGRGKAEPDRGADWPRRRAVGCAGLLEAGLLGAIVSRTLAHRHHRRPQSHTIPVPCIGMVRQGRRARGGTRYRAGRVHHPTGSPEQRVPPGPSSSICSRGTSTRRLTLPQPRSSGRSCGQRSSGRTRARACCPPRRAESVIQRAVRRRQGPFMPLSGDRTERDLWVMSQPVAISPNPFRLKRAAHTDSPGLGITPHLTPSR